MSDAPERIWVEYTLAESDGVAWSEPPKDGPRDEEVEYIRADMVAAIRREAWEEAAGLAESYTERRHIAHDISTGDFPKRSDIRDAIAAALRDKAKEAGE